MALNQDTLNTKQFLSLSKLKKCITAHSTGMTMVYGLDLFIFCFLACDYMFSYLWNRAQAFWFHSIWRLFNVTQLNNEPRVLPSRGLWILLAY